jgi:hypothetical protein
MAQLDQESEMTLTKILRRVFIALLLTSMLATFSSGVVFAQLPFDNLTPAEDSGDQEKGGLDGAPFEQEGPMRPIDRTPVRTPTTERPDDDDLGEDDEPVQSVEVKERFAGWQGAGELEGERLSDTLRANWVMLDRNGQFTGTVRGIDQAAVAGMTIFLMNNGRLVKTAAVQGDGSFIFTNVQRGAYSLVGWGDKAFFAFGANIINANADADDSTPTSVNCYAFQNETTINTDWISYFAPNIAYRVFGRYSVDEGEDDPDHLYGFEGLTSYPVMARAATSIGGVPVALDARGRFVGRVHQMNSLNGRPVDLRSTKIMLLKGDNVIGSTTTDNFGVFQFSGVRPGGYGLLAVGVDGVGLVGVQVASDGNNVLDAEGAAGGEANTFDFTMVSAETVGWLNHYAREVAYRKAILKPRMKLPEGPRVLDPVCPDGGIPGPDGRCPGASSDNPICRSPCITYGEWVANGCACANQKPALRRIGDRVRESVEKLDNRFESAFYGESSVSTGTSNRNLGGNASQGSYGNGYQNPGGYQNGGYQAPVGNGYGIGIPPIVQPPSVPPIVQPNAAPLMPMARGQQGTRVR